MTFNRIVEAQLLLLLYWMSYLNKPSTIGKDRSSKNGTWTNEEYCIFFFFDWVWARTPQSVWWLSYGLEVPGFEFLLEQGIFLFSKTSIPAVGSHPISYSVGFFPHGLKLTSHHSLAPRLRMDGAISPLPYIRSCREPLPLPIFIWVEIRGIKLQTNFGIKKESLYGLSRNRLLCLSVKLLLVFWKLCFVLSLVY